MAWVFNSFCDSIPEERVDAGLASWTGSDCATFVRNVGLPQYCDSFEFNLSGGKLPGLQMGMLAQMGVATFSHQKEIMKAIRNLIQAYERKTRTDVAAHQWDSLLTGEGKRKGKKCDARADSAPVRAAAEPSHRPNTRTALRKENSAHETT